jgi:hypothetical protein
MSSLKANQAFAKGAYDFNVKILVCKNDDEDDANGCRYRRQKWS